MVEGSGCDAAISCGQGAGRVVCGSREIEGSCGRHGGVPAKKAWLAALILAGWAASRGISTGSVLARSRLEQFF